MQEREKNAGSSRISRAPPFSLQEIVRTVSEPMCEVLIEVALHELAACRLVDSARQCSVARRGQRDDLCRAHAVPDFDLSRA